jgi:hypothetical protein
METITSLKGRYSPGRIDGGRAFLEWELEDGRFSMSGEIWDRQGSDCVSAGQCVDEIADSFPNDKKLQRMREIWERWHLNDMKAGSPAQEHWLKAHAADWEHYQETAREAVKAGAEIMQHYQWAASALSGVGLNPDRSYRYTGPGAANIRDEGAGYTYGSAWIKDELPPEIVAEITAWSEAPGAAPADLEPFEEFIKARKVSSSIEEIDERPDSTWDGDPNARHFRAVLHNGKARLTAYYSQGSGIKGTPKTGDILRAIVSNAQLVEGRDFKEFAAELGLDDDSRKAEKSYRLCSKEAEKLRRFLGEEDYKFCLYGEEAAAS